MLTLTLRFLFQLMGVLSLLAPLYAHAWQTQAIYSLSDRHHPAHIVVQLEQVSSQERQRLIPRLASSEFHARHGTPLAQSFKQIQWGLYFFPDKKAQLHLYHVAPLPSSPTTLWLEWTGSDDQVLRFEALQIHQNLASAPASLELPPWADLAAIQALDTPYPQGIWIFTQKGDRLLSLIQSRWPSSTPADQVLSIGKTIYQQFPRLFIGGSMNVLRQDKWLPLPLALESENNAPSSSALPSSFLAPNPPSPSPLNAFLSAYGLDFLPSSWLASIENLRNSYIGFLQYLQIQSLDTWLLSASADLINGLMIATLVFFIVLLLLLLIGILIYRRYRKKHRHLAAAWQAMPDIDLNLGAGPAFKQDKDTPR